MKKLFNITLFVMGCLIMASCGDDDYTEKVNTVQVTEGRTEIPAAGATKTLTVTGQGIQAEADDEWLDVSVDGNTITLTADANYSRESRHTFVTIKAANGDFLQVNVSQLGAVFVLDAPSSLVYGDDENVNEYNFNTNLDVTITTSEPWLSANLVDGKLTITTEENTTGQIRTGYVYYQAGTLGDRIEVTQGDIDKDIVGKYFVFGGVDPDEEDPAEALVMFLAQITKTGTTYNLVLPQLGFTMPVTFNKADLTMTINAGNSMGRYQSYYVYSVIGDAAEGLITWDKTVSMTAKLMQDSYTDEDGTVDKFTTGSFLDDGKWSDYASDSFAFGAFKSTTLSSSSLAGTLAFFTDVFIEEYDMAAGAKPYAKAKTMAAKTFAPSKKYVPAIK